MNRDELLEYIKDGCLIACICEGSAEQAIIELLLENKMLIFEKEQLLEDKIIRIRGAKKFEDQYLKKKFNKKIIIIRVLDSLKENFNLSALYKDKIYEQSIITKPEIEMLIIFNKNKLEDFKKSRKKPSDYCKENLKFGKSLKTYKFVKKYFNDTSMLKSAILAYHNEYKDDIHSEEKLTLFDILKNE